MKLCLEDMLSKKDIIIIKKEQSKNIKREELKKLNIKKNIKKTKLTDKNNHMDIFELCKNICR